MATPPFPPGSSGVVLIVDDEADIGVTMKAALRKRLPAVRALAARTPEDGLAILAHEPVDLVISDFRMPGMTGLEFLAKARERSPGVVRVMMTAFPNESLAIHALNDVGIVHFLTKPFPLAEAVALVERLLDGKRAEEARQRAFARALVAVGRPPPLP
ncbi:MAG TPA: response regulator [Candidatus Thermoplasmatota archaeon]|nr:response regulator [Candidatus Thermoplasmatota archaeon]